MLHPLEGEDVLRRLMGEEGDIDPKDESLEDEDS